MERKPKILVVDPLMKDARRWFGGLCEVYSACNHRAADSILATISMDIILLDVKDMEGLIIASCYKLRFPKAVVCLWTTSIQNIHSQLWGGILCVKKTSKESVVPLIMNQWFLKNQELWAKEKRDEIASKLAFDLVSVYFREPERSLEALHMRLRRDPEKTLMSVACRNPENPNQINLYLPLMYGCYAGCLMCGTCKLKGVTKLRAREIVAPISYLLESHKALGYLEESDKISIGYPNGGDPIYCWEELCQAIEITDSVGDFKARHTVTSIGDEKIFKQMFARLSGHDVSYHISGHSTDEVIRGWLMPATKGDSLKRLVDLCSEHNAKTGQRFTYAHMLIKGLNCSQREADEIANLLRGTPFDVNVMTISDGCLAQFPKKVTARDGLNFAGELKQRGVKARFRENIGKDFVRCGRHLTTHNRIAGC